MKIKLLSNGARLIALVIILSLVIPLLKLAAASVTVICSPNPETNIMAYDFFIGAGTNQPALAGRVTNTAPVSVTNGFGQIESGIVFVYTNLTPGIYRIQVAAVNDWNLSSLRAETNTGPANVSQPILKDVWINVP